MSNITSSLNPELEGGGSKTRKRGNRSRKKKRGNKDKNQSNDRSQEIINKSMEDSKDEAEIDEHNTNAQIEHSNGGTEMVAENVLVKAKPSEFNQGIYPQTSNNKEETKEPNVSYENSEIPKPVPLDQEGFQTVGKTLNKSKGKRKRKSKQGPRNDKVLPVDQYECNKLYSDVYQSKYLAN